MSMIRYEPLNLFNQLSRDWNQVFDKNLYNPDENGNLVASDWVPAVDVKEEDDCFVIHADVPGVDPDTIDIHMEAGVLTISGERHSDNVEERKGYKRVERVRGSFLRRFTLPDTAESDKITANSKNGVLEVLIPKHDKVLPRKIKVNG
ncbi:MAG TPA: Hsp20/alpha crystallin family protein [Gammaproteobacteria bacterium]|nr:Hsp20/alpha crystallin family protein [Gammaproteobacteria bacterium]